MRKLYFLIFSVCCLLSVSQTYGQAPNISYAGPKKYVAGPDITPLVPASAGGAVPNQYYAQASTLAGSRGYGNTDGAATVATFANPLGITKDPNGNIFVADANNNVIRKITPDGTVSTFAGSGASGATNGAGTLASFNYPTGLTSDNGGNIYVADYLNSMIRKITPNGIVTTLAGDGTVGNTLGAGSTARFNLPYSVAFNKVTGFLIISDSFNHQLKKVNLTTGDVTLLAGSTQGVANGTGAAAQFNTPFGITVDKNGVVFAADKGSGYIRTVSTAGEVGIFNVVPSSRLTSIAVDNIGFVYVSSETNNIVRIQPGQVTQFSGTYGRDTLVNKIGTESQFSNNAGLAYDNDGNLLVADARNLVIRKVTLTGFTKPNLPAGLTVGTDGVISGRPTAVTAAADYNITAYNTSGLSNANINIEILPPVLPAPVITFAAIPQKTYGNSDFAGGATSTNANVKVTYSSDNTLVATVKGDTIHIAGAGSAVITANQVTDGKFADAVPVKQSLTVIRSLLTITADNKSRLNGIDNPPLTATFKGFVNNENASALIKQPVLTTTAIKTSPTGNYPITVDSAVAANYTITYVKGNLFVGPQAVISFPAIPDKAYGDAKFKLLATSNNSKVPVIYTSSDLKVAGIRNDSLYIIGAGTATITANQLGDSTYSVANPVTQTVTIKTAPLTIAADNKNKLPGADNPVLTATYTGFVYNETKDALTTPPALTTTAVKASPGGDYPISITGAASTNYTINLMPGTLHVGAQAAITFPDIAAKVYGNPKFALLGSSNNAKVPIIYASSDIKVVGISNDTAYINGPGTAVITATQAGDAAYFEATPVQHSVIIAKADLTIKADDKGKIAGVDNPPLTITYTGFVYNQDKSVLTTQPTITTTALKTSPEGDYPITVTGATAVNYNIKMVNGNLKIGPQPVITFPAIPQKTYGDEKFAIGASSTNKSVPLSYITSDIKIAGIRNDTLYINGAGTATITATQPSGGAFSEPATVTQTVTIKKAPLTAKADNKSRIEGAQNPTLSVTFNGFVYNQDRSVITTEPVITTTATQASANGDYPITVSGAVAANYDITYIPGTLHIGPRAEINFTAITEKTYGDKPSILTATSVNKNVPITFITSNSAVAIVRNDSLYIVGAGTVDVIARQAGDNTYSEAAVSQTIIVKRAQLTAKADDKGKLNGADNPLFTVTYSGFINNDTRSVVTTAPVLATTATKMSSIGTYPITISGAEAANYDFNYVTGTLTVTNSATISFPAIANRTYGDADQPAGAVSSVSSIPVSYTSSNTAVATILNGLVHIVSAGTTTITATYSADTGFGSVSPVSQQLTVNKAVLTAKAEDKIKAAGDANPILTIAYSGFIKGETASVLATLPTAATTATVSSAGGNYPISVAGGLAANYSFNYVAGTLNVLAIPVITAGGSTTFVVGGSVMLSTPAVNGYQYQWYKDSVAIAGAVSPGIKATESGSYTVTISMVGGQIRSAATQVTATFFLPADNFKVSVISATCKGANNGAISIIPTKVLQYTAFVSSDSFNGSFTFDKELVINSLKPGNYLVCIFVNGQTYQQCFNMNVTEPKDLSVYSTINKDQQTITLQLSGSEGAYHINLNDVDYTTSKGEITLPLKSGINKYTITTDRLCQGVIEKTVTVTNVALYPNPFQNILNVNIGDKVVKNITYNVFSITNGKLVHSGQLSNQSGLFNLDLSAISGGIYYLKLNMDGKESAYKIIKQ